MILKVKVKAVVFGVGDATLHLLVRHVRRAGQLARPRSHPAPGAVRRAVAVEVEAVREGRFVEEVGGQIVVKIWKKRKERSLRNDPTWTN